MTWLGSAKTSRPRSKERQRYRVAFSIILFRALLSMSLHLGESILAGPRLDFSQACGPVGHVALDAVTKFSFLGMPILPKNGQQLLLTVLLFRISRFSISSVLKFHVLLYRTWSVDVSSTLKFHDLLRRCLYSFLSDPHGLLYRFWRFFPSLPQFRDLNGCGRLDSSRRL